MLYGEVQRIDSARRVVMLDGEQELGYDYLVVATGASSSYLGNERWAAYAPSLKTLQDAYDIRRRVLLAFERAEREEDAEQRATWLSVVVIGAGATGVELAGRRESQAADHRAVVVRRDATQGGRVGAPRNPRTEFGFLRANRLLSGSAADALAVGIWSCVTFVEQDAVQIRAELLPLVSDNFVVVEFDLEFETVTEHFPADLALFRIRTRGEAFQFLGDQPSELRARDCFLELQPLVFDVAVEPHAFRFAELCVDSHSNIAHALLAPLFDVPAKSLASTID